MDLVRRRAGLFPRPADEVAIEACGYNSNFGRHLQEGHPPFEQAELVVGLSGAMCRYLGLRLT